MKFIFTIWSYVKTRCTNCGVETKSQPPGDGCHSCQAGWMKPHD